MPSKKEGTPKNTSRQKDTGKSTGRATSAVKDAPAEVKVSTATAKAAQQTTVEKPTAAHSAAAQSTVPPVESGSASVKVSARKADEPREVLNFEPTVSIKEHMVAEMVAVRAYHLWEQRGRQHGFHSEDWAHAEFEVRSLLRR
jgi:hypothetical protein